MSKLTLVCPVISFHHPIRLNRAFPYERLKRIADGLSLIDRYFDDKLNQELFVKLASRSYYPLLKALSDAINLTDRIGSSSFKISFFVSGLFFEQASKLDPQLLELIKKLVASKRVEILGGNYFHSLASVFTGGMSEFIEQVKQHNELMKKLFGVETKIFMNTDLIYNSLIGNIVKELGFRGILTEATENMFEYKGPTYIYSSTKDDEFKLIFRHRLLSDDLTYRFSQEKWSEFPLTAEKYAKWLSLTPGDVILLAVDVETFGEYNTEVTGIFNFLKQLPIEVAKKKNLTWSTPSEVAKAIPSTGLIFVPETRTISRSDAEKDMSAWLENPMQRISFDRIMSLAPYLKEINDANITKIWRYLQQSENLYFMSTKAENQKSEFLSRSYFSSPAEAFAVFNSVYSDFEGKVATLVQRTRKAKLQPSLTPKKLTPPASPSTTKQTSGLVRSS